MTIVRRNHALTVENLDQVDRRLLKALQEDGRISNAELARRCNLSPAACFERVRRLKERGVITGYAVLIDPAKVGRGLMIFVEVLLDRTTGDQFEAFAEMVRRQPEVLECHMVAGGFDYLIKARVGDMDAYRVFLGDVLVRMPGVRETRTYAVLEEVKSTTALPL
ncbi:MAG: ArsR family transcriptional regulator [Brevundimonas sp.]|nr:ArsR family transcriptional regulator [Brevundimonas sp.]